MRGVIACLCISLLSACTFDNEPAYVPITQSILFLTADSQARSSLYQITDQTLVDEASTQFGLPSGSVSDLDSDQTQGVWLCTPAQREIHYLSTLDGPIESYPLGDFQPHFITVGQTYALLSDTTIPAIGFFHLRTHALIIDTLQMASGRAIYRSRYFFVPIQDSLAIYQEDALTTRNRLGCVAPIVWQANEVTIASSVAVICQTDSGEYLRYDVDYNSLQWIKDKPSPINYRKIWYTPYVKSYFTSQRQGEARVPAEGRPDDLFADFLMGERYLVRSGLLSREPGRTGLIDTLGTISGDVQRVYVEVGYTGP